jgi:formylglycine-generating enzyme required for sulfatase activity
MRQPGRAGFIITVALLTIFICGCGSSINNPIAGVMVLVKGGTFTMGCTAEQGGDCQRNESPAHQVTLSDFYIGKYEVTQKQWKAVMGDDNNPSNFKGDDLPVEMVSWNDVQEFITKLNVKTGKNYRLPTEAEWEYAARGGNVSKGYKYGGSVDVNEVAWYGENGESVTHRVGTKKANELGIHDMSGNVYEWVHDLYGNYRKNDLTNPQGSSTGSRRVFRGGSWYYSAGYARVSYRSFNDPDARSNFLGFRLALNSQ